MGDKSKIQWTEATWNPLRGCSRVSEGCRFCYAERRAHRIAAQHRGLAEKAEREGKKINLPLAYEGTTRVGKDGQPRWTGKIQLATHLLDQPLRWAKPRVIFSNSMSDLFHENVPFEYIAACFGVMATSQRHTFQCLTKRPGRALEWFEWLHQQTDRGPDHKRIHPTGVLLHHAQRYSDHKSLRNTHAALTAGWPLSNVQIGVSVENQPTANERIQELLKCQAAVRFISYEPALGPVDFTEAVRGESCLAPECWGDCACDSLFGPDPGCRRNGGDGKLTRRIDWIIIGGESGHGAREFDISWARSTIEQCRQAGVPVFVKQLGSKPIVTLTNRLPGCMDDADVLDAIRSRKGADMSEWPPDLRIREFPTKQTGTHPWFGERS